MKKASVLAVALVAAGGVALAGPRDYSASGFDRIDIGEGVELAVTIGTGFSVSGEALRGSIDRLQIDQRGSELVIGRRNPLGFLDPANRDRFRVTVTMPAIHELNASSGSAVVVSGSVVGLEAITVNSGASASIGQISVDNIAIDVHSGGHLDIGGHCGAVHVEASSGARVDASDLTCEQAELDAHAGADLDMTVTGDLRAEAYAGGSITVAGAPTSTMLDHGFGGSIQLR